MAVRGGQRRRRRVQTRVTYSRGRSSRRRQMVSRRLEVIVGRGALRRGREARTRGRGGDITTATKSSRNTVQTGSTQF